jgi:hypothetical protein
MNLIGKYPVHYDVKEFYVGQTVYTCSDPEIPLEVCQIIYDKIFVLDKNIDMIFMFGPQYLITREDKEFMYKEKLLLICVN